MSRTITVPDWDDITGTLFVIGFVLLIVAPPLLAGYGLWLLLAPVGFWQMLAMLIGELFIVGGLYFIELLVIAIIA